MTPADPTTISWLRILIAMITVAALLAALAYGLKYLARRGIGNFSAGGRTDKRMHLVETLPLDVKRRVVILRCDDAEHIVLLGTTHDLVIASRPARESSVSGKDKAAP